MSTLRLLAVTALTGLVCSGCSYWQNQAESIYKGQAVFADGFFMLDRSNAQADLPAACQASEQPAAPALTEEEKKKGKKQKVDTQGPDFWTNATEEGKAKIHACTIAMKQLIDIRWAHFSDAVHGSIGAGSAILDTMTLGLNAAGALTPGDTTQILSAVATGFSGFKTTINEDILYKNSVHMILQQMEKDRALRATIILIKLKKNAYQSMMEAASDLYAYNRAGTWTNALVAMQADSGNKLSECKAQLRQTELSAAISPSNLTTDLPNVGSDPCTAPSRSFTLPEIQADSIGTIAFGANSGELPKDGAMQASNDKIIAEAVEKFAKDKYTGFVITGQVDKTETAQDAEILSKQRAEAVKAELIDKLAKNKKIATTHYTLNAIGIADPAFTEPDKNRIVIITLTKEK